MAASRTSTLSVAGCFGVTACAGTPRSVAKPPGSPLSQLQTQATYWQWPSLLDKVTPLVTRGTE